jgi:O-acetyl-ADP-ribose deacetylase (regulator of RNase III)
LELANQRGHSSIAFPVLGAGVHSFPKTVVARVLVEAVNNFNFADQQHLKDVSIIVYQGDADSLEVRITTSVV